MQAEDEVLPPGYRRTKWEYNNYLWDGKEGTWNKKLNEMGEKGWEAYSVVYSNGQWEALFKRPKQ